MLGIVPSEAPRFGDAAKERESRYTGSTAAAKAEVHVALRGMPKGMP